MTTPEVQVEFRGSIAGPGQQNLRRSIGERLQTFFDNQKGGLPSPLPSVLRVVVNKVERGGHPDQPIKIRPYSSDDPLTKRRGLPVVIHTEGTQGAFCDISVSGWDLGGLRNLFVPREGCPNGDHQKGEYSSLMDEAGSDQSFDGVAPLASPVEIQAVSPSGTFRTGSFIPPTVQTIRARLEELGESPERMERLRATMAWIVHRHVGEVDEYPAHIHAPVSLISEAILAHMGLSCNKSRNYQGIIGSFYSTRIALFGQKSEATTNGETYADWLISVPLVLDFVDGKDNLGRLAQKRDEEVAERVRQEKSEQTLLGNLPLLEATTDINQLTFEQLTGLLGGRQRLLEFSRSEVSLARENVEASREKVVSLERQLAELQAQLAVAQADVTAAEELFGEAEARLLANTPPPELTDKLREAKQRFDALMATFLG